MLEFVMNLDTFFCKHKTKILSIALAATTATSALMIVSSRDWEKFLNQHPDIKELYFTEEH